MILRTQLMIDDMKNRYRYLDRSAALEFIYKFMLNLNIIIDIILIHRKNVTNILRKRSL